MIDSDFRRSYSDDMTMTQQFALEHFEDLLDALANGETVVIERPNETELRLLGAPTVLENSSTAEKRILGAGVGEMRVLSDQEWEDIDKEWRASFADKFDMDAA